MKNLPSSFKSFTYALPGAIARVLACGFILSRAFAVDTPTPESGTSTSGTAVPPLLSGSAGATTELPTSGISSGDAQITDPNIIAQIADTNVTMDDMRATIASLDPDQQAAVAASPELLMKVVRTILMERVVMKEITAKQWDQQPAVAAHLEKMRVTALADMYLTSVSQPPSDFPSDAELHQAYDAHKAAFAVPHQFLFTQVFVALPINADKDASAKAQARLDAIIKELQQPGADFASVARSESDDKLSAQQGGEMGWMTEDKMAPKIRMMAHVLAKGVVSKPVRLADGWHILKLLDTKDFSPAAFDDVKERLAQLLRVERERTERLNYINKLLQQYPVTINDAALPNLLKKAKQ